MGMSRGRLWLALVVVVAAGVFVAVLLMADPAPQEDAETTRAAPPTEHVVTDWTVRNDRPRGELGVAVWLVDDLVVFAAESVVVAYHRADGAELWRVRPPVGVFCGASPTAVDGVAALAFGRGEVGDSPEVRCGTATLLDLRTGELRWQREFTTPRTLAPDAPLAGAGLQLVGDMVVIAQAEGMLGLSRADGTRKWARDLRREPADEPGCTASDMVATPEDVVVAHGCAEREEVVSFSRIDPATGRTTRTVDLPSGSTDGNATFVSSDPLIAWLLVPNTSGKLVELSADLRPGAETTTGDYALPDAGIEPGVPGFHRRGFTQHHPTGFLIDGDTAYGVTTPARNQPNKLVALDLTTGTEKWSAAVTDTRLLQAVAVDGGAVVVAGGPAGGKGPLHTIRLNATNGTVESDTTYEVVGEDGEPPLAPEFRFFWADNRMVAVRGEENALDIDLFAYGS